MIYSYFKIMNIRTSDKKQHDIFYVKPIYIGTVKFTGSVRGRNSNFASSAFSVWCGPREIKDNIGNDIVLHKRRGNDGTDHENLTRVNNLS